MKSDILILGAGASGLMLASLLPKGRAIVLESNAKVGAKIAISGGGKCNITNHNMGTQYYLAESHFIAPSLEAFSEKELLQWLEKEGLKPVLRKESQYFCKKSSSELLHILERKAKKQQIILNTRVKAVEKREGRFYVKTDKRTYSAKHLVIASGGLSFPKLGASAIGYEIAKSFGHSIVTPAPALVGFTVQKEQFFFKELSGISTDVLLTIGDKVCKGALLFAHKGLSGPVILDASLYWKKGKMSINFLPHFSWKDKEGSQKQISSLLPLPKRVSKAFLLALGLEDKSYSLLNQEEKNRLLTLSAYVFSPAGTFGYSKAEVTKGGVCTEEVSSVSMMSQKEEGLYFLGEVLDVTGELGGYNFQWAFSSAYASSKYLSQAT
jgi:predicted Rossmann fold flavoprotein